MPRPVWRVVVAREIDGDARDALARVGATHVSGHSGPGIVSNSLLIRAETEDAARAAILRALGENTVIPEARAMPVYVNAPIAPEARSAFEQAAGEDARVGGVIEEEHTGNLEVYFELPADNADRVFNEARGIYARICEDAGLRVPQPLEMTMSGFEALMVHTTRDRQLLAKAEELLDAGEHELAVVLAQTACEVLIADAIRNLLQPHASDRVYPWLLSRVRSFTLVDDPTRELFDSLTGSKIADQSFWQTYREHVRRRHQIVHEGATIDEETATASLDAAKGLFDYVEQSIGSAPLSGPGA